MGKVCRSLAAPHVAQGDPESASLILSQCVAPAQLSLGKQHSQVEAVPVTALWESSVSCPARPEVLICSATAPSLCLPSSVKLWPVGPCGLVTGYNTLTRTKSLSCDTQHKLLALGVGGCSCRGFNTQNRLCWTPSPACSDMKSCLC